MDLFDHLGRVWITFEIGKDQQRFSRFRRKTMLDVYKRWPSTASLPIMPSGAIPLPEDMQRTPSGYRVKVTAAAKYQESLTPTPSSAPH